MHTHINKFLCFTALALSLVAFNARAALTIEITGGATLQIPIAIAPFPGEEAYPEKISKIVAADLARSGLFKLIDTSGMAVPRNPQEVRVADWKAKGVVAPSRARAGRGSGSAAAGRSGTAPRACRRSR